MSSATPSSSSDTAVARDPPPLIADVTGPKLNDDPDPNADERRDGPSSLERGRSSGSRRSSRMSPLARRISNVFEPPLPHNRSSSVGSTIADHRSLHDAESLAAIDRPPSEHLPPSKTYHPFSPAVLALLIPASILGVLTRLGLQALATYDGRSIFPLAYPQAVGCFFMGFALAYKEPLGNFYAPFYTAITTGFCGSVTTFSGWQLDVFESWINATQSQRGGVRDVLDGITKSIFTLIISLCSVWFGAHIANIIRPYLPHLRVPPPIFRYTLTTFSVLFYFMALPPYFHLPAIFRHEATAALLFSFPGTLTRYVLSVSLNPRVKLLPAGTLTANLFGTALLGAFHLIQSVSSPTPVSANVCALLQGLADGYCGCLTTVSTFAAEVDALEEWKAWLYAGVSWVGGQLILLVILGSAYWGRGLSEQQQCGYSALAS